MQNDGGVEAERIIMRRLTVAPECLLYPGRRRRRRRGRFSADAGRRAADAGACTS